MALGQVHGDRVALLLPDGALFSMVFWGAIAAGAVAVPLNTQLTPEHLEWILRDCEPRLVVFDPALAPNPPLPEDAAAWTAPDAEESSTAAPRPGVALIFRISARPAIGKGRRPFKPRKPPRAC